MTSSDGGSAENGTTNFIEDWGPDPWGFDFDGSFDPGSVTPEEPQEPLAPVEPDFQHVLDTHTPVVLLGTPDARQRP